MVPNATPLATVVIPTLDRSQELESCQKSLEAQKGVPHEAVEVILIKERGPLAQLRNQGLSQARAPVVSFIDDDVVCSPTWLSSLLRVFRESPQVMGVTGPAIIPESSRPNRDIYRFRSLTWAYTTLFVYPEYRPGHLTTAGTFVPTPDYSYQGSVQFLEACNMSFRTEALKAVGGFDEAYGGIGDWSEPDCAFRLRQRYGNDCLWFSPDARLEHHPSRGGAYLFRDADARQRLDNYRLFASRWVPPTLRHRLYRAFLTGYYAWKQCSAQ